MHIAGLQKMTLLDFPGKVACTVFLQGCNFRCPFCHNSDLLGKDGPEGMTDEELLKFLDKRRGLLDAVCITGGEPTLQPELEKLICAIKEMGYAVKLDTNGAKPEILKKLSQQGLLDYVAMDIKNSPEGYGETVGVPGMDISRVEQSIKFLLAGEQPYEFRTTVVAELHDETTMESMGKWLSTLVPGKKPVKLFLQGYIDRDSVLKEGLHPCSREQMESFVRILRPFVDAVEIRGME
ncbi:MAG: anaerobic ribonucleoside-triphosphate reductase activating protein [Oscillospiraceae bacterium]|nr:anaerobic ribonucleoside-triphosphate reductase activating protein [Oscillospiraceae bacterium]